MHRTPPSPEGFSFPAEWERHEATWLAWPHNKNDWPGKFATIQWVFGEVARRIAKGEKVRILVHSSAVEKLADRALSAVGTDMEKVEFFRWQTERVWVRDYGPIFVRSNDETAVANFNFNGWAKYPNHKKDDKIPARVARKLGMKVFDASHFTLEGGAVDVNGRGTMLTTEECLLDETVQARNPGLGRSGTEEQIKKFLGVTNVLWLGKGIYGDDTHGHVDDICRFVNDNTVVLCAEENSSDVNYRSLNENRERLEGMRLEDGSKINVAPLPMPGPITFKGQRLPASYANFYITNSAVLVPTFNDPKDRIALGILADFFPGRTVVGIHSVDLVWGLGTIHCLTKQQP